MDYCNELSLVYSQLCKLNFGLFCNKKCNKSERDLLKNVINFLFNDKFYKINECECDKEECIDLLNLLINTICVIEKNTCWNKNYSYLLQLEHLSCTLDNLKSMLCQLRCLPHNENCELLSKVFCTLIEVLSMIIEIISKINNIECLCNSCVCCRCKIIDCLICDLDEKNHLLDELISNLSHLVLQIVSLTVINCTTCNASCCTIPKKCDCSEEYCESYYPNKKYYDIKHRNYYK